MSTTAKHVTEFSIVRWTDVTKFTEAVNTKLQQGWFLHGNTFYENGMYHQAMHRMVPVTS